MSKKSDDMVQHENLVRFYCFCEARKMSGDLETCIEIASKITGFVMGKPSADIVSIVKDEKVVARDGIAPPTSGL